MIQVFCLFLLGGQKNKIESKKNDHRGVIIF